MRRLSSASCMFYGAVVFVASFLQTKDALVSENYLCACDKSLCKAQGQASGKAANTEKLGQQQETALENSQDWLYC